MKNTIKKTILGLAAFGALNTNMFGVDIFPSSFEHKKEQVSNFELISTSNEPVVIKLSVSEVIKDEFGKTKRTLIKNPPFTFSKKNIILKPQQVLNIKAKYLKEFPQEEIMYEILATEKILKSFQLKNSIKPISHRGILVYVGGKITKKPTCSIKGNKLTINNPNNKHIRIGGDIQFKDMKVFIKNSNGNTEITEELKKMKNGLYYYFLQKKSKNTRTLKNVYMNNSECIIK